MKYKRKNDIGQTAKVIFDNDALDIIRTISINTWIYEVPSILIELINDNFEIALETVKYIPNVYFKLNDRFRNDRQLINATIRSFSKHNRINEINVRIQPLTKRNNYKKG